MTSDYQLAARVRQSMRKYQPAERTQRGFLGMDGGTVRVPAREHYVYVRLWNGEIVQAFNRIVPATYGLAVTVAYRNRRYLITGATDVYQEPVFFAFPDGGEAALQWPGTNTLYSRPEQILIGSIQPIPGSVSVRFYGANFNDGGVFYNVLPQDIDLSASVPATGAEWALIELTSTGINTIVSSGAATSPDLLQFADIPAPTGRAIYALKLYASQIEFVQSLYYSDIFDLRWFEVGGGGAGDVVGPASATDDNIVTFDGTTGKLIQDSGVPVTQVPSSGEKSALAGTSGTPGSGNKYVTNADSRLSDARTPTSAGLASVTHAATNKATPADNDEFLGTDSAASYGLVHFLWSNIKAALKTYSDTLYLSQNGWVATSVQPTRTAADDPTYSIQFTGVDYSANLKEGVPVTWVQNSITRYGYVSGADAAYSGGNTSCTILTRLDSNSANYDVLDTGTYAITNFAYGLPKQPGTGFPTSESVWTFAVTDTTTYTKTSPTQNTWFRAMDSGNLPSATFPLGRWRNVSYFGLFRVASASPDTFANIRATLSTSTSSQSDGDFTFSDTIAGASGSIVLLLATGNLPKLLSLAAKTTYYLLVYTGNASAASIQVQGATGTTTIRAICDYL